LLESKRAKEKKTDKNQRERVTGRKKNQYRHGEIDTDKHTSRNTNIINEKKKKEKLIKKSL
jgi:hypothetical protein